MTKRSRYSATVPAVHAVSRQSVSITAETFPLEIPGVGEHTFSRAQVSELHRACVGALEASLPVEDKSWRDDPARARTSGVKATADLARNRRKAGA